jgi:hypothetical protein
MPRVIKMENKPEAGATPIVKTKLPDIVVSGDDFVLTRKGVEYHPHAGETVTFRGESSWAEQERSIRLQYLAKLGPTLWSVDEQKEMMALAQGVVDDLARHIVEWTWTDAQGDPLPNPPPGDVLTNLPAVEIVWLILAGTSVE